MWAILLSLLTANLINHPPTQAALEQFSQNQHLHQVLSQAQPKPHFTDENQFQVMPSTSPTHAPSDTACTPRPACLDSTPPCYPSEPAEGWCPTSPNPSPQPEPTPHPEPNPNKPEKSPAFNNRSGKTVPSVPQRAIDNSPALDPCTDTNCQLPPKSPQPTHTPPKPNPSPQPDPKPSPAPDPVRPTIIPPQPRPTIYHPPEPPKQPICPPCGRSMTAPEKDIGKHCLDVCLE